MRNKNGHEYIPLKIVASIAVLIVIISEFYDIYFHVYRNHIANTTEKKCNICTYSHYPSRNKEYFNSVVQIIEFDSCEYLILNFSSSWQAISHKGNCKYCVNRLKK